MTQNTSKKVRWAAIMAFACATPAAGSVGFQQVSVPDANGKPIAVGIWYPSDGTPTVQVLGATSQTVALSKKVSGKHLPLILISHGNGGSLGSHYDTAIALAEAGFVIAAPTHTGDNYADQSYAGNRMDLIDRPRQMIVVLDWILSSWTGRRSLDPRRVGVFGFSLGGFTALVLVGGTPELQRMRQLCSERPQAPECLFVQQRHGDQLDVGSGDPVWRHDTRIRAAVVAAPAAAYLFGPEDLKHVQTPIQLWRAEKDESAPDAWNSALVRQGLPGAVDEHLVRGASHFAFLAPCSKALAEVVPFICVDPPGFDRTTFHRDFNQSVVHFFAKELQ
jgi:predicted dienelactone hydrolase